MPERIRRRRGCLDAGLRGAAAGDVTQAPLALSPGANHGSGCGERSAPRWRTTLCGRGPAAPYHSLGQCTVGRPGADPGAAHRRDPVRPPTMAKGADGSECHRALAGLASSTAARPSSAGQHANRSSSATRLRPWRSSAADGARAAAIAVDHFHLIMLDYKAVTTLRQHVTRDPFGPLWPQTEPVWAQRRRLLRARETCRNPPSHGCGTTSSITTPAWPIVAAGSPKRYCSPFSRALWLILHQMRRHQQLMAPT